MVFGGKEGRGLDGEGEGMGREKGDKQSVIIGIHFAYRQSIIVLSISSLCCTVCDRKFVSTSTEYGGIRAVLCWKKRADDT